MNQDNLGTEKWKERIEPHKRDLLYPDHMPNDWLALRNVHDWLERRAAELVTEDMVKRKAELERAQQTATPEYDRIQTALWERHILLERQQDLRFRMLDANPHCTPQQRTKKWRARFGKDDA